LLYEHIGFLIRACSHCLASAERCVKLTPMDNEAEKLLAVMNEAQKQAITHDQGPLLIVAGAGTGKTSVLTKRLAYLVMTGKAKPDEILAVTFTDKAAGEMEERIDKLLPYGYVDLWVMTFHALGERLLRDNALAIGLPDSFKLLSQTDQWLLIRRNLERFNLDYYKPLGNPTKFIHALLRHVSRAKDEIITPEEYSAYAQGLRLDADDKIGEGDDETKRLAEVAEAYHVYTRLLRENDALDFGDLINEAVRLLETRPAILERYRKRFKYIIVDEFQDTNIAQFALLRLLAGDKANITVVGDDDQSVYKFRGASVSNILQFKEYYPQAVQVVLTENYRSPQAILDAAYKFIQTNNPNRLEVRLGGGLSKKLHANVEHVGLVEHLHERTVIDEARAVAKKIKEIMARDPETDLSQFVILSRSNEGANPFIAALAAADLPYIFYASAGLYQKPVVLDIVNYLKLLDDYHESPSLYRLLAGPVVDVSHDDIVKLTHAANQKAWSLYEACRNAAALGLSATGLAKIASFLGLLTRHTQLSREKDVRAVIFAFLEDTGYLKRLVGEGDRLSRDMLSYINQFWRVVEGFTAAEAEPTARLFLDRIRLQVEAGDEGRLDFDPDIGPEAVRVMTVHASKGLEFDYVFLVSLIDRRFPSAERSEPIELPAALVKEILPEGNHHLEEERRLFYVGMTRAKKGLFLTFADDYGGARKRKPSRFLEELGVVNPPLTPPLDKGGALSPPSPQWREGKGEGLRNYLPSSFSFTQFKAFENCPLQYKFAHILKIPVKGKGAFSFGKTMHAALQKMFALVAERQGSSQTTLFDGVMVSSSNQDAVALRQAQRDNKTLGELVKPEELDKLYEESWIDDWYENAAVKKAYRDKGRKLLAAYYDKVKDQQIKPVYLEKPFTIKAGDSSFRGAIDRLDECPDGTVKIVDYKTGTPKEAGKMTKDDKEQLLIYQIACLEVLGKKPSALSFVYLENGTEIEFIGKPEELEELREKMARSIGAIKNSEFPADPSEHKCRHCDFREICEFRII
jgi:DNA helicase II / ATP-dependent DNA helicase PcrA